MGVSPGEAAFESLATGAMQSGVADQLPDASIQPPDYDPRAPQYAPLVDAVDADYRTAAAGREAGRLQFSKRSAGEAAQMRIDVARGSGQLLLAQHWAGHVDRWRAATAGEAGEQTE